MDGLVIEEWQEDWSSGDDVVLDASDGESSNDTSLPDLPHHRRQKEGKKPPKGVPPAPRKLPPKGKESKVVDVSAVSGLDDSVPPHLEQVIVPSNLKPVKGRKGAMPMTEQPKPVPPHMRDLTESAILGDKKLQDVEDASGSLDPLSARHNKRRPKKGFRKKDDRLVAVGETEVAGGLSDGALPPKRGKRPKKGENGLHNDELDEVELESQGTCSTHQNGNCNLNYKEPCQKSSKTSDSLTGQNTQKNMHMIEVTNKSFVCGK